MSDVLDSVLDICNILGVKYDLSGFSEDCDKLEYLLNQIYFFIGGSEDA